MDQRLPAPKGESRLRLEPSEDRSWPPFGRLWPNFGVLPELLGAHAERHEKTRVRSSILSDNAIRIMSALPQVSKSRLEPSEDRSRPPFGRLWPNFGVLPELLGARAERHEKTRVQSAILSENAILIASVLCRSDRRSLPRRRQLTPQKALPALPVLRSHDRSVLQHPPISLRGPQHLVAQSLAVLVLVQAAGMSMSRHGRCWNSSESHPLRS